MLRELATMVSGDMLLLLLLIHVSFAYVLFTHPQGLAGKPIVTVWNKIDLAPERKEFLKFEVKTFSKVSSICYFLASALCCIIFVTSFEIVSF